MSRSPLDRLKRHNLFALGALLMLTALAAAIYLVSEHLREKAILQRGPGLPSES